MEENVTYTLPPRWQDLPDTPGKRVLEEILNTPPVDREKLHQESLRIQKYLTEKWAEEDRLEMEAKKGAEK